MGVVTSMARPHSHLLLSIAITLTLIVVSDCIMPKIEPLNTVLGVEGEAAPEPRPTEWPDRFHALLVLNDTTTSELSVDNLWYDWPRGLNVNLIQYQLGKLAHDVEWNNGTLFYYFLGDGSNGGQECRVRQFEVGIPRRNWMEGAIYLGQSYVDGFLCNVWNKVDFTWYYEDVLTKRPIMWYFFNGLAVHVITFEVGAVLEDSKWQAPVYCFDKPVEQPGAPEQARQTELLRPPVAFV